MSKACLPYSCLLLSALLLLPVSDLHAAPKDELERTQAYIKQAQEKQAEMEEESNRIEAELAKLQRQLVPSAEAVQRFEADLSATENKLLILDEQLGKKEDALEAMRVRQFRLAQAALRLSRTPPEAAVLMPVDQADAMKTARLLMIISDQLKSEAKSIREQWAELQTLRLKVAKNHAEMLKQKESLGKKQKSLRETVAERQALQKKLNREQEQESKKLAELGREAENLQALIATLDKKESEKKEALKAEEEQAQAEEEQAAQSSKPARGTKGKLRSFASAKGGVRPPVAGKLVQSYGGGGQSQTNKGVVIQTREKAQVTAPYDGEVVFTGPFLRYGRMVILRHSDDFHTLLAGVARIDVSVGEFLLEGEPIGAMGEESSNRLYVELRKNNQSVDPAPWIKGMKKK